jgi:DNA-binding NtrC family response regulator
MMGQSVILVLDFDPANVLGKRICEILALSFSSTIHLRQEPATIAGLVFGVDVQFKVISQHDPALILIIIPPGLFEEAGRLFQRLLTELKSVPVVAVTESGRPDEVLSLLRLGVADFLTPPFREIDVLPRVWRLLGNARPEASETKRLKEKLGLRQLIGESPAFIAQIKKFPAIAKCGASVFIYGETGTGKELCARAIHYLSQRVDKPFIPVNCGAIPLELIENELFGHERGAFTGASAVQPGLIREADGGTLFLDEIDCLPLLAQVKFLRFLQEKEYRPLGATKMSKADVRIIAATNINCEEALKAGKLRRDLYYRLNVVPLALPPLRERQKDISLLARHFLTTYAHEFDRLALNLSDEALRKLQFYHWPGNVRELEHIIERAVMLSEHQVILDSDIVIPELDNDQSEESFGKAKARVISEFEKIYIQRLLVAYRGNVTKAAEKARKNRRAFWQLIRKHGINVQDFRSYAAA